MDKETLSNYGWIVILVLILSVLLALATPFGNFIAGAIKATTAGFFSVNQGALEAAGIHIPGQDVDDPFAKKGHAVFDKYMTNPGCHTDIWPDLHTEDCYTFEEITLTWDELMLAENGVKYGYDASMISDTEVGEDAFNSNTTLLSISFPSTIVTIGEDAFCACEILTTVDFSDCTNLTTIGESAFSDCEFIISINLSNCINLETIGDSAFEECYAIQVLNLNGCTSLTTIYEEAFENCEALATVNLNGCINLETIDDLAFADCFSLTAVDLRPCTNLTTIGEGAFGGCDVLADVAIPNSVTTIGTGSFYDCKSLKEIKVDSSNPNYCVIDGILYTKDMKTLVQYPAGKTETTFTIPESVITIGESAFSYCTSLTGITIPESVTTIGDFAFGYCTSLTSITFNGTMEQWNAVDKYVDQWGTWHDGVPATYVQCSDGQVALS